MKCKNFQVKGASSGLNVRSMPSTEGDILFSLKEGEVFQAPEISGWVPVLIDDNTVGWVSADYVEETQETIPSTPTLALSSEDYDFTTKEGTIEAIVAECCNQGLNLDQTAYVLATTEWETARTFKPVREAYWKDEEYRRNNFRYYPYYGRGYVQLTWEANYRRFQVILGIPLVENPDLALDPYNALLILVQGMRTGAFTGKKLSDYINDDNVHFYNARRVVNGLDHAQDIANLAEKWRATL